jgi:hypothetical protein
MHQNQLIFQKIDKNNFFISNQDAFHVFKVLTFYKNALGYDGESDGFFVLHKGHSQGSLNDEIEAVLLLKQSGFGVFLNDESQNTGLEADVTLDGFIYDIKRMRNAENPRRRILKNFEDTLRKGATGIILHRYVERGCITET